jgi:hypothetical protein
MALFCNRVRHAKAAVCFPRLEGNQTDSALSISDSLYQASGKDITRSLPFAVKDCIARIVSRAAKHRQVQHSPSIFPHLTNSPP